MVDISIVFIGFIMVYIYIFLNPINYIYIYLLDNYSFNVLTIVMGLWGVMGFINHLIIGGHHPVN